MADAVFPQSLDGVYQIRHNPRREYMIVAANSQWLWFPSERRSVQLALGWSMTVESTASGHMLANGGKDGVQVFSLDDSGNPSPLYKRQTTGAVCRVVFSPDSRFLAICVEPDHVEILEAESGKPVNHMISNSCYAVAFSDDSSLLMTGGGRGSVWKINHHRVPCSPTGDSMGMSIQSRGFPVDADPSLARFAVGDSDGVLRIVETASGAILKKVDTGSWVNVVRFSPSGSVLGAGSKDGWVRIYDATSFEEISKWKLKDEVEVLEFDAATELFVSGSMNDPVVHLRDVRSWNVTRTLDFKQGITFAKFLDQGGRLLIGDAEGTIWSFDLKDLGKKNVLARVGSVPDICVAEGRSTLAIARGNGVLVIGGKGVSYPKLIAEDRNVSCVAVSADGSHVAFGSGNEVTVWNIHSDRHEKKFVHEGHVEDVLFDVSNGYLFCAVRPSVIQVWDLIDELPADRMWQESEVEKMLLTKDSRFLLAGGSYSSPSIWRWEPAFMLQEARSRLKGIEGTTAQ